MINYSHCGEFQLPQREPVYYQPPQTMHIQFVFIQVFFILNILFAFPQSSVEDDIFGLDYDVNDNFSEIEDDIFGSDVEKCSTTEGYR